MPYLEERKRSLVDGTGVTTTSGELTYRLYVACLKHLPHEYRYGDLNEILGCLEATKQEFYRRVVAPYEDKKIAENGDVEDV